MRLRLAEPRQDQRFDARALLTMKHHGLPGPAGEDVAGAERRVRTGELLPCGLHVSRRVHPLRNEQSDRAILYPNLARSIPMPG